MTNRKSKTIGPVFIEPSDAEELATKLAAELVALVDSSFLWKGMKKQKTSTEQEHELKVTVTLEEKK